MIAAVFDRRMRFRTQMLTCLSSNLSLKKGKDKKKWVCKPPPPSLFFIRENLAKFEGGMKFREGWNFCFEAGVYTSSMPFALELELDYE